MAGEDDWAAVAVLAEPTRRRVFEAVRSSDRPLTRDDVAGELGVRRPLAAFHLDRLVDAGLLDVSFARPPGRSGPGAGRPTKHYAADATVAVSFPPRQHELVARLLARAVSARPRDAARQAHKVAGAEGRKMGELGRPGGRITATGAVRTVSRMLGELGYDPVESRSWMRLRNCPFHGVVDVAPALVCEMNE